ncbi:PilZ domain-containing protein [Psychrosphaera aestuarii]|uniref:PilZ domain-containing protein n=1 Tax=Psychrosphaera aestuarii TaxID=1266052 RepID=UPI001B331D8D|nr:PilZ domain-containing protein [Psychrosphaera aestuarii]
MIRYDDNRNFFRMMVNTSIEVEISDADAGRKIDAVCRDLSATGLAIETDEHIEPGTQIMCRVDGTNSDLPALQASATVVRCTLEESGVYTVGVEINEQL